MKKMNVKPLEPIPGPYSIVWGRNGIIHGESIFDSEKEAEKFYEEQAKRWFDGCESEFIYRIMLKEGRFIEFNGGCTWELDDDGYYSATDCDYGYSMDVSDYRYFNEQGVDRNMKDITYNIIKIDAETEEEARKIFEAYWNKLSKKERKKHVKFDLVRVDDDKLPDIKNGYTPIASMR